MRPGRSACQTGPPYQSDDDGAGRGSGARRGRGAGVRAEELTGLVQVGGLDQHVVRLGLHGLQGREVAPAAGGRVADRPEDRPTGRPGPGRSAGSRGTRSRGRRSRRAGRAGGRTTGPAARRGRRPCRWSSGPGPAPRSAARCPRCARAPRGTRRRRAGPRGPGPRRRPGRSAGCGSRPAGGRPPAPGRPYGAGCCAAVCCGWTAAEWTGSWGRLLLFLLCVGGAWGRERARSRRADVDRPAHPWTTGDPGVFIPRGRPRRPPRPGARSVAADDPAQRGHLLGEPLLVSDGLGPVIVPPDQGSGAYC